MDDFVNKIQEEVGVFDKQYLRQIQVVATSCVSIYTFFLTVLRKMTGATTDDHD